MHIIYISMKFHITTRRDIAFRVKEHIKKVIKKEADILTSGNCNVQEHG